MLIRSEVVYAALLACCPRYVKLGNEFPPQAVPNCEVPRCLLPCNPRHRHYLPFWVCHRVEFDVCVAFPAGFLLLCFPPLEVFPRKHGSPPCLCSCHVPVQVPCVLELECAPSLNLGLVQCYSCPPHGAYVPCLPRLTGAPRRMHSLKEGVRDWPGLPPPQSSPPHQGLVQLDPASQWCGCTEQPGVLVERAPRTVMHLRQDCRNSLSGCNRGPQRRDDLPKGLACHLFPPYVE